MNKEWEKRYVRWQKKYLASPKRVPGNEERASKDAILSFVGMYQPVPEKIMAEILPRICITAACKKLMREGKLVWFARKGEVVFQDARIARKVSLPVLSRHATGRAGHHGLTTGGNHCDRNCM